MRKAGLLACCTILTAGACGSHADVITMRAEGLPAAAAVIAVSISGPHTERTRTIQLPADPARESVRVALKVQPGERVQRVSLFDEAGQLLRPMTSGDGTGAASRPLRFYVLENGATRSYFVKVDGSSAVVAGAAP